MKSTRKILPIALLGLALCACGARGTDVTSKQLPTDDPTSEVEVTFWHCLGHDKSENLNKIVSKFNTEYSGKYRVTPVKVAGDYDSLHDTVKTRLASGEIPALCMGYPDSFSEYMTNDVDYSAIYRLDSFFDDENYGYSAAEKEDFVDAFLDEGSHYQHEGIWSVPMYKSTEIMYYNANYFCGDNPETTSKVASDSSLDATKVSAYNSARTAVLAAGASATDEQLSALKTAADDLGGYTYEVPATWDELITLSRTVIANRASQKIGGDFYPFGYDSDANLLISLMAELGIPYTANGAEALKDSNKHFVFNNNDAKALVEELVGLYNDKIMITKALLGGKKYTNEYFTNMQSIMSIGSTGGSSYNVSSNFKVKLAPVPYKGSAPKYIQQGPSICFFDNDNDYMHKGAWLFYKMLADAENNAALALENSYDPVRDSSFETTNYANWIAKHDLDLKYDIPYTTAQIRQYYFTSEVFVGSSTARTEIGKLLSYVANSKMSVNEAFSTAYNICCNAAK